jgi:hypothetical protein
MRRIRFNIASLLAAVLLLAVGFAALKESNDLWDSGLFSLTLIALLASIPLAVHRGEASRAFWFGFALFGWGYLAVSLVPSIEFRLLTTKGLAYLDSKMPGRPAVIEIKLALANPGATSNPMQNVAAVTGDSIQVATSGSEKVTILDATTGRLLGGFGGTSENFMRIGHSLLALLAAWFGGLLSRLLWRTSQRPQKSEAVDRPIGDVQVAAANPGQYAER